MQIADDFLEREAVRLGQRDDDVVLGRGRLELEVELAAEALAERQPPTAVDAAAKGGVDDQLHAAGFVEEALEYDRLLRRKAAKRAMAGVQIVNELLGRARSEPDIAGDPLQRGAGRRVREQPLRNIDPQAGYR